MRVIFFCTLWGNRDIRGQILTVSVLSVRYDLRFRSSLEFQRCVRLALIRCEGIFSSNVRCDVWVSGSLKGRATSLEVVPGPLHSNTLSHNGRCVIKSVRYKPSLSNIFNSTDKREKPLEGGVAA